MISNPDSEHRRCWLVRQGALALVMVVVAAGLGGSALAQTARDGEALSPPDYFGVDPAELDQAIPSPHSVIGHPVGERAVSYPALVRYLQVLSEASPAVTITPYAQSHEGRTLYYLTITSAANHARLDDIRGANAKLADPRLLGNAEDADRIIEALPAVAWMAYSIHGDELSSTDAAMQLAYQLAAGTDRDTQRLRDELVIHIDPLMNPDGRERYLAQIGPLTGKVPNPDYQAMHHDGLWSAGRGNHYLFDLNRDWLMQVHPETRGRAAAILAWNPHLLVDSHEMGGLDTYLFDPPREPLNPYLSEQTMTWRRRFSADQARAFDRHGWSYYTGEWHEEWYPGYSNAWASLLGATGLLYEQARVDGSSVKQATGRVLTYRETVHHQLASSLANLETLRANRQDVLRDYFTDRQWAVTADEPHGGVFLLRPPCDGRDRSTFNRFLHLLSRQGIEAVVAEAAFEAEDVVDVWGDRVDSRTFEPGTLVVRSTQPHRRLLHAVLSFDPHMSDAVLADERKELENHRGSRIYDTTAWNLPMAYGLDAYWAQRADVSSTVPAAALPRPEVPAVDDSKYYGYLIDGADRDVYRALARLLERDCKPRVASKPFKIADQEYQPGTILLRALENPADLPQTLRDVLGDLSVELRPVETALCQEGPDLGAERYHLLQPPRVAIAAQWPLSSSSFGAIWHLLDARVGLRVSPINIQKLGGIDLRKYNVLLLPNTWNRGALGAVLNEQVVAKLKTWVEAGGTLIAVGATAAHLATEDRGLSNVCLKRDVLDELAVYDEAVERERAARRVQVDSDDVWGTSSTSQPDEEAPAKSIGAAADKGGAKPDHDALRRADEWQRLFHPRGCIAAASLDPEHWLCFGLGERVPVILLGGYAYMSRHPVATPVRLLDEQHLRLSGLLWPEARRRWADTAYATVESVGHGQVILFSSDPFFRGYWEGSGRLLLNAVLLGPGMGTSPPLPW